MEQQFVVSSSPFIHSKNDINRMFLYIALALVFPTFYGILLFGIRAFIIIMVSVGFCALFEALYNLFDKKKFILENTSFLITGLILALSLPYKTPIYVVIICDFIAIVVVKMAFGGIGRNYFNPALTARCVAGMMIPAMASELYSVTIAGDEYISIASGGTNSLSNLLSGQAVGGIGTTCIIMLLIGFVVLSYLQIIESKIPLLAILSYIIVSLITHDIDTMAINLFSGSFIFVCVFVMTDPNTSPNTFFGKIVYSVAFGSLSALVWDLGVLGENTVFVVALFVNMFVPLMDKYFIVRPTTLGGYRNAHKN